MGARRYVAFAAVVGVVVAAAVSSCTLAENGNAPEPPGHDSSLGGAGFTGAGGTLPDAPIKDVKNELGGSGGIGADADAKIEIKPDVPDVQVPEGGTCFPGTKKCPTEAGLECVIPDIYYGCGLEGCDPCNLPWAIPKCENEECVIESCTDPLRAHCKGPQANGCETMLTTNENCGACGAQCAPNHASGKCPGGKCQVDKCETDFADCDNNPANGCEVDLRTDKDHCGACNSPCGTTQKMKCENKACVLDQCTTPGTGECDGNTTVLCETNLNTDENNCGACKHKCSFPHAGSVCTGGVCMRGACDTGWDDCDDNPDNGCEMDIHSNPLDCGGCDAACKTTNAVSSECEDGICKPNCKNGWGNCNGEVSGTSSANDGCETHISVDVDHCGSCDAQPCSNSHGTNPTCTAGKCYLTCNTNWANCNGAQPGNSALNDGCEVNTLADPDNCGGCNNPCNSTGGTATCAAGKCGITCSTNYGNCDSNPANGCEIEIATDISNCGVCGKICSSNNGTPSCTDGKCEITCTLPWADCNGQQTPTPNDGCETNTSTAIGNCGTCGTVCVTAHTQNACVNGHCTITGCGDGYGNCDGDQNNGCETATQGNVAHCGACLNNDCVSTCPGACSIPNAVEACSNGSCVLASCEQNYADCGAGPGCETNTSTDPNHCGNCTTVCNPLHSTASCTNSVCGHGACESGYLDCDSNTANGCETHPADDILNCGNCNIKCEPQNSSPLCTNGACGHGACFSGYMDCDGIIPNGCEADIFTGHDTCGNCTTKCLATEKCVGGSCQLL